jgi:hypothetical protein
MNRASKFIDGFGVLSERSAEDVLTLAAHSRLNNSTAAQSVIICATAISQSLQFHYDEMLKEYKALKFYHFIKKYHWNKAHKADRLLLKPKGVIKALAQSEIYSVYMDVLTLEGVDLKKKVAETPLE